MRPLRDLIAKEEATARLLQAASRVTGEEELALAAAVGRVAARAVVAPVDVPPFRRALMDGYAVGEGAKRAEARLRDEQQFVRVRERVGVGGLRVVADAFAGRVHPPLEPGTAVRIATGAPVPDGATAVVRVEDTTERDGIVELHAPVRAGQFIEPLGADVRQGEVVVAVGDVLTPARLGLLASVGLARVAVSRRPRVEVRSSGDELLRPGEPSAPGRIYDANGTTLTALLAEAGADVRAGASLPDELDALRAALRTTDADMLVVSGGASAGDKDLLVDAVRAEGELLFHGVRVKPGKPLLAARVGRRLLVGLPGNPTSALSNAAIFVVPALRRMAGLPLMSRAVDARLGKAIEGEKDRYLFLPVRLADGVAVPTFKGSSALTSLAGSDGWVGVPEGATLAAGSTVSVALW